MEYSKLTKKELIEIIRDLKEVIEPGNPDIAVTLEKLFDKKEELEDLNANLNSVQQELEFSRQKYFELFDQAPVGYIKVDTKGNILEINATACRMIGSDKQILKDIPFTACIDQSSMPDYLKALSRNHSNHRETRIKLRSNTHVMTLINHFENFSSVILMDLTDKRKAEAANSFLSSIVEHSQDAICTHSLEGTFTTWNRGAEKILGYSADEMVGQNISILLPDEYTEVYPAIIRTLSSNNGLREYKTKLKKRGGEIIDVSISYSLLESTENDIPQLIVMIRDISDQIKYEEQLRSSVKEKEMLLKEIHHRVKNNLQVISSILNVQKQQLDSTEMKEFLTGIQNRIRAMALVHQQLYSVQGSSKINIGNYISELAGLIGMSYQLNQRSITFSSEIDKLNLDIDFVIDMGLIFNELMTNSLKYAFDKSGGEIKLIIKDHEDYLNMFFSDNGKGMVVDPTAESKSLGLTLITSLVEQHNGTMEINVDKGTEYRIKLFY